MVEYSKVNVKLDDIKLNSFKNAFKNAWLKWSASRIVSNNKTKKTKLRNPFNNNMSAVKGF